MQEKIIVGVDPDSEKNGVAILFKPSNYLELKNLKFFELFSLLHRSADRVEKVVVEAGWLNGGHFHTHPRDTIRSAAKKGNDVGRNHETGRKIVEMCEYLGLKCELVRPSSKKWTADYFKRLLNYAGRTNQEQRDAAALVVGL